MTPDQLVQRLIEMGIRQRGDPILTTRTKPFDLPAERAEAEALRDQLLSYIPRLRSLYRFSKGVGLAAPQIGSQRSMAVVSPAEDAETILLTNPIVLSESKDQDEQYEGCLSFFDVRGSVLRPLAVRVQLTTLCGDSDVRELEGSMARLALHEIDHLWGLLYSDRLSPDATPLPLDQYRGTDTPWNHANRWG